MDKMRQMISRFFAGEYDPLAFSLDFEEYLCDHYDEMKAEDPVLTGLLNENFPEICASYERGADPAPFAKAVREEYERVMNAIDCFG